MDPEDPRFSDPAHAKNAALKLITRKSRSRADLVQRLEKKGYSEDAIEPALRDLERVGLVDDERLARDAVAAYLAAKPAGERFLMMKLRQRLVDPEAAKRAVKEAMESIQPTDEAERLLRSRARAFPPNLTREAAYRRLLGAAARRGFDADVAREAVHRVLQDIEFASSD